jgi:excisionase family DNA binding protein
MEKCTTTKAADLLGVTRRRVLSMIAEHKLYAEKPGRDWLIPMTSIKKVMQRKPGRPSMKNRDIWIRNIISFNNDNVVSVTPKKEGKIYYPGNRQYSKRLKKDGLTKKDMILCRYAIKMGAEAEEGKIKPFPKLKDALEWIEDNKDFIFFIEETHSELKCMFPCVPVVKKNISLIF